MLKKYFVSAITIIVTLISPGILAAGNISISKTISIGAPAATVWEKVKDFNGLHTWHPAVAKTDILAGENNTIGTARLLTLNDGGTIEEDLIAWDGTGMTFTYIIIESVLPVSDYEATMTVDATSGSSSKVTWSASFNAGKGADDQTARDTISGIFDAGLENLVKIITNQ